VLLLLPGLSAQERQLIHLWPGIVPGEGGDKHPARVSSNNSRNVTRLTDVTDPVLEVYPANPATRNGVAVIVCPGGGYSILAIDLEGYEVAEWLSGLGYTAFVLQYRVPRKQHGALQDIQRAIKLVRYRSAEWHLHPASLGILGFSAGGSLCARASTRYEHATYDPVDRADSLSARPDFAMLVYPAYLDRGADNSLTPELAVDENTPPMFLFGTADDRHANSIIIMGKALRDHGVPVEMHLLPEGGHGYGLRFGNRAAETWPGLAENWLRLVLEQ
jgi:acetyl esterase/lipase